MWICEVSHTIWRKRFLRLTICAWCSWQMALNIGLDMSFGKMSDWTKKGKYNKWGDFPLNSQRVSQNLFRIRVNMYSLCFQNIQYRKTRGEANSQYPRGAAYCENDTTVWKLTHGFLFPKECNLLWRSISIPKTCASREVIKRHWDWLMLL